MARSSQFLCWGTNTPHTHPHEAAARGVAAAGKPASRRVPVLSQRKRRRGLKFLKYIFWNSSQERRAYFHENPRLFYLVNVVVHPVHHRARAGRKRTARWRVTARRRRSS
jgi:hypothetical protein